MRVNFRLGKNHANIITAMEHYIATTQLDLSELCRVSLEHYLTASGFLDAEPVLEKEKKPLH